MNVLLYDGEIRNDNFDSEKFEESLKNLKKDITNLRKS